MEDKIYIAYGSNLNLKQMAFRCPTAEVLGTSELKDYELVFRGAKDNAYATIEPCVGKTVPILLWKVKYSDEKALDRYEGYPIFYEKEELSVPFKDGEVTAFVYKMTPDHELNSPSLRYINTILEGYNEFNFDTSILYDAIENTNSLMLEKRQDKEIDMAQMNWW